VVVIDDATSPGAEETWWDISTGTQSRGGMGDGRHESAGQRRMLLLLVLRCFVAIAVLDDCVGTNSRLTWTAPGKKRIMTRNRDRSPPDFCIVWSPPATDRKRDSSGSRSAGFACGAASASAKTDIAIRRTGGTVMVEGHSSSLEHSPFFSFCPAKGDQTPIDSC
jgi:hypothetical protein